MGRRGLRDVAIYAPNAGDLYGRHLGAAGGGGAELQTVLLAHGLVDRGMTVAHIVLPVEDPLPRSPSLTLVERPDSELDEGPLLPLREFRRIWRTLSEADASAVVVRGSGGYVLPIAAWCRYHRRAFVFATSNDLDFDMKRSDRRALKLRAYDLAARQAGQIVVQTQHQLGLARKVFPKIPRVEIPSFMEPAEPSRAEGRYFLWSDRLTEYKRPDSYLDLAVALPEARFRIILSETSETPPALVKRIHARIGEIPNLELVPRRSRPELLKEIESAVAIVKTSEVEGMPNTFLEAWARAVPVLSLSVDPDRRIAEHGVGVSAEGSMPQFEIEARRLWEDPAWRHEIGARARKFVFERHSIDGVADRWAKLLSEQIERR
jgi:glycosyltransferase involved in cell wall biosynthesis